MVVPETKTQLANGTVEQPDANGAVNGRPHTPVDTAAANAAANGLALTEYSAQPSPPGRPKRLVPDDLLLPDGTPDYLRLIITSLPRVREVCTETPLTEAANLSARLDCRVLLKREDLQPVFSFKLRGAYNMMAHLDASAAWRGIVCCSAGNHAQGVAYSARKLKIPATIVMPRGTPSIKHRNVARMGGHVVLHGADFDEAKEECARRAAAGGLINVPPFDDPYVIAGQGTIGMEILSQTNLQKLTAIFCCVGGGGLIAGVGVYVKRIAPHVRVIGVEAYDADAMTQSLEKGERVVLKDVGLFADGAAVKTPGEENFRLAREVVDEMVRVTTDETCAAIKDVFEDTRAVVEPAGALAVAGMKKWVAQNPSSDPGRTLVAVTSGANMNFDRLGFVAQRATLGEGREALLAVTIPERPGAFLELVERLMPHNITEFSYRYATAEKANVLVGLSLNAPAQQRAAELSSLLARVAENEDMRAVDLSGDELAKSHVRHMVGGRSGVADERLYMFRFPERPGALEKFLRTLQTRFNISLFQYRNHGGDVGQILTGIQCPAEEVGELEGFLGEIGYPWEDCTEREVFKTFLRG